MPHESKQHQQSSSESSSQQQQMVHRKRVLDSSEDQRVEKEKQERKMEKKRLKEEKKKRKEIKRKESAEKARKADEEAQNGKHHRQTHKDRHHHDKSSRHSHSQSKPQEYYSRVEILLEPDSDSDCKFRRVEKKIRKRFHSSSHHDDENRKKNDGAKENGKDSRADRHKEDKHQKSQRKQKDKTEQKTVKKGKALSNSQHEQSQEQDYKRQKKANKRREQSSHRKREPTPEKPHKSTSKPAVVASSRVKQQQSLASSHMSLKDRLVQKLAIRWWYVLPVWPPKDYDYEGELKKIGFRQVKDQQFRFVDEVVDGLVKVQAIKGFPGLFRTKNRRLIDIRPKSLAPSIQNFQKLSVSQLSSLIKLAISKQIQELSKSTLKRKADQQLIRQLREEVRTV